VCADTLVRQHQNLVHWILRRQFRHDLPYEDLFQEGLIGLWQAVLHFDPQRGFAFSSYATVAIARHIWLAVKRMARPQGVLPPTPPPDPAEQAAQAWWATHLPAALRQALTLLPHRLHWLLATHYGLNGAPPQSLAQIGRRLGLSRERARQLHQEALHRLRLPALSAPLRWLCEQNDRAAYRAARAQRRAYQRAQRRRSP
jgi:RNA polymerase sigma factor (sigma-70 family)